MRNKIISVCLIAVLLLALPITAYAQNLDFDQLGAIRVTLLEKNGTSPIVGAELSIYHVATVALNSSGNLSYTYTEPFEACGSALDDPELAIKLEQFLNTHFVTATKAVTDSLGTATCTELPLGLYFIMQTDTVGGFAPCKPFLVTIPLLSDGVYHYEVETTPKTEVAKLTSITIKKVWNTDETSKVPDSVTVQLLRNGSVVKTATLNTQNQWQVTFPEMPESDDYSVREINIPQGFTVTYAQNGYSYTVTNTAALLQTGQLTWPIPAFAIIGVVLLAVGTVILRKERQ